MSLLLSRSFAARELARPLLLAAQRGAPAAGALNLRPGRALSTRTHTLELPDSKLAGRTLSYKLIPGQLEPTLVYVPGLHSYSHMDGMAAQCMLRYCDLNNFACVLYDHECMGASRGGEPAKVLFTHWVEDVLEVVKQLTEGPVILVSLSMGAWLSLVAAQRLPAGRLHGLVLYAPALNYAYQYYHRHIGSLPPDTRKYVEEGGGSHFLRHSFGDALLKRDFAEDSRQYEIDLEHRLPITCPVRILHGLRDTEVKPQTSLDLCEALDSTDVKVIFRKEGKHQADTPPDIEMLLSTTDRLIKDYPLKEKEKKKWD